ncbi:MAG: hypothetical protein ORN54_08465 [Cyclobacteriaceae bacterium]|nr:hypothetical protein [Cyclobacteriaceae bacterium]
MRFFLIFVVVHLLQPALGQFKDKHKAIKYEFPAIVKTKYVSLAPFGLLSDEIQTYRYSSPTLMWLPGDAINSSSSFWIGNVSSQSYSNGRFGTYYYWDIQGNLQGTRGFLDLSVGKKRGVKLVFPWR